MPYPWTALFFLLLASALRGAGITLIRLGRLKSEKLWKAHKRLFFFYPLGRIYFSNRIWEGITAGISLGSQLSRLLYAFFLLTSPLASSLSTPALICLLILPLLLFDFALQCLATANPRPFFLFFAPFTSIVLFFTAPFSSLYTWIFPHLQMISKRTGGRRTIRDRILELFHDTDLDAQLDHHEQKLLLSVASFKERIAREVMVPRIDLFALSAETSMKEASKHFSEFGYSRIPVYREHIDNIIGVLLYKDLLNLYAESMDIESLLSKPIENLVKPVLFTPETKKISLLLQEFRTKQTHLAIVVDEYGGTEGLVTIEDILEEIVGEITDEHDIETEVLFSLLPSGDWIVDGRMSIHDIEDELNLVIPPSTEYETIGGYVFHRAGMIPKRGWRVHHDDFDLEVLSSSERVIEKIRITPRNRE